MSAEKTQNQADSNSKSEEDLKVESNPAKDAQQNEVTETKAKEAALRELYGESDSDDSDSDQSPGVGPGDLAKPVEPVFVEAKPADLSKLY